MQNFLTVGPPPSYPHDFVAISKGFEYFLEGIERVWEGLELELGM